MLFLGYDIGSSSVKASIWNADSGKCIHSAFYPKQEMKINAPQPGWAEQDPESWWENLKLATQEVLIGKNIDPQNIKGIGISYQMHGLVVVDKQGKVLRPSIIWCDSRAVEIGSKAFKELGEANCLPCMLNSPGNFTASKLKWVKDNEPALFEKIDKIMLPGDYIAFRLTGNINTTTSGLSEGILWDFKNNSISDPVMGIYGFPYHIIPPIVPTFGIQGQLSAQAAKALGLAVGTPIAYRAGDQPNNALSLNVLNPGEVAATAGTSGVVYGVSEEIKYDPLSRVNTFAHVNHTPEHPRLGVLLCINGTGILYSWLKKNFASSFSYEELNNMASAIPEGSEGLQTYPFGNGAERVLQNKNPGCSLDNIDFNRHSIGHIIRSAQEGIVFSFKYGMEVMHQTGINPQVIKAGKANMFLSSIFRETMANLTGVAIELYNTDGSLGAARGAAFGTGYFSSLKETFSTLEKADIVYPNPAKADIIEDIYQNWKLKLNQSINK